MDDPLIVPSEPQKRPLTDSEQQIRADTLADNIQALGGPHRASDDFEGCTE